MHGGDVSQEQRSLLDRGLRQPADRFGKRGVCLLGPAGAQGGVTSEPGQAGRVVVVKPRQVRLKPWRAERLPGPVDRPSAAVCEPALVWISDSTALTQDATRLSGRLATWSRAARR